MGKGKITPQDHPTDRRRIDELEETFQPRSMRRYSRTPSVKQLRNTELVVIDDGTAQPKLGVRIDGVLYGVDITAL